METIFLTKVRFINRFNSTFVSFSLRETVTTILIHSYYSEAKGVRPTKIS